MRGATGESLSEQILDLEPTPINQYLPINQYEPVSRPDSVPMDQFIPVYRHTYTLEPVSITQYKPIHTLEPVPLNPIFRTDLTIIHPYTHTYDSQCGLRLPSLEELGGFGAANGR